MRSESVPSPSGSAIYRMTILAEVPVQLAAAELAKALDEAGAEIGVDVKLELVDTEGAG